MDITHALMDAGFNDTVTFVISFIWEMLEIRQSNECEYFKCNSRTRKDTLDSPLVWIIMGTILGLIACKLT